MKVDLYDNKGKKASKQIELEASVFAGKINQDLLRQYVYTYLGNQRQSNAHTKERGDVRGGGKKPWKQKGTGRARHGSSRSPIWKGGSVTFGPSNDRNFKKVMPKKMKQAAMRAAFAQRAEEKGIVVLQDPDLGKKATTKQMVSVMHNLNLGEKIMLLQATADKGLMQATRNIPGLKVSEAGAVNAYEVLNNKVLVILESALPVIAQKWGKPVASKVKPEVKSETKTKGGKK